jgi:hypothetical protein
MSFRGVAPRHGGVSTDRHFANLHASAQHSLSDLTRPDTETTRLLPAATRAPLPYSSHVGDVRLGLVLLGVIVAVLVILLTTHNAFMLRADDLLAVARRTASSVAHVGGTAAVNEGGKSIRVCAHRGIDQSQEMVAARPRLRELGWTSLSHQFRFLCHVPTPSNDQNSSHNVKSSAVLKAVFGLRKHVLGARSVCCADYDVLLSSDGTPWVGRPETIAGRVWVASGPNSNNSIAEDSPNVRQIAAALQAGAISDATLDAALGPLYEHGERLVQVAAAVAQSLLALSPDSMKHGRPFVLSAPRIHTSLELKIDDSVLERNDRTHPTASGANGSITGFRKTNVIHSLPRANSRVAAALVAAATLVWSAESESEGVKLHFPSQASFTRQLLRSFVVILDPVFRFRSIRQLLLRSSPEYYLPYLATTPQIAFSLALLDRPLLDHQLPLNGEGDVDARSYCMMLTAPPPWAADVMPSLRVISWCLDLFPRLVLAVPRSRDVPINCWLVDSRADATYVHETRERYGLRQLSSVVSNVARDIVDII